MNLKDKTIVITGGASGLGAATARQFVTLGAKVSLLDMNLDAVEQVAKSVDGYALQCDVTDAKAVEQAWDAIIDKQGVPHVCVNCAGVAPAKRIVGREGAMPLEDFTRVININLNGTFNVMRIAAFHMSTAEPVTNDGERGVIINTASVAAYDGQIGQAAYSASKGGVAALTLPAARELARFGVRVMTIAPGIFATPMMGAMPQNVQDSLAASVPFPARFGQPEEYAKLAQHIVENEMLNGEVIRLDGAIRMQPK